LFKVLSSSGLWIARLAFRRLPSHDTLSSEILHIGKKEAKNFVEIFYGKKERHVRNGKLNLLTAFWQAG
jgi:hypothetical protein